MKKRSSYEFTGDEDDYALKCQQCRHSYVKQDASDELRCSCRNGECNFEPYKENLKHV